MEGGTGGTGRDGTTPAGLVTTVAGSSGPVAVHVWPALEHDPDGDPDGGPGGGAARSRRGRPARRRADEARRPVLVALHGWTESGAAFGPLADALGRRWTVVAPDAPGHGGTPWRPAAEFVLDDQAPGALAVLDALPVVAGRRAPVVVLGHGTGALPAATLARVRPRAVRHVVLEEPARTRARAARRPVRVRREVARLQALDLAGRVAAIREAEAGWPEDELLPWAVGTGEVDPAPLRVPTQWGPPLVERLADVRQPVLLVRGDPARGGTVSAAGAARAAAACRAGCEVLALDAGHGVRRDARAGFVAALAAVLGRYEH